MGEQFAGDVREVISSKTRVVACLY